MSKGIIVLIVLRWVVGFVFHAVRQCAQHAGCKTRR